MKNKLLGFLAATLVILGQGYSLSPTPSILLEDSNTIVLRGVVTQVSMDRVKLELIQKDKLLEKGAPIYLFLETPGGDVIAGMDMISVAKSLDREVKTITKFAASMGFVTTQHLGERIIFPYGILMSHRAFFGVEGQYPGEIESRFKVFASMTDDIEATCASRMALSTSDYKSKIHNEYWIMGNHAVEDKAADKVSTVRCGDSMMGTREEVVVTPFGQVTVLWHKCPMITSPISANLGQLKNKDPKFLSDLDKLINFTKYDAGSVINDFIINNKFKLYLK